MKDGSLRIVLGGDFEAVTGGNEVKHDNIVTKSGAFDFSKADKMAEWASNCGLKLFGHTLGWHNQQQCDFLNPLIAGAPSADSAAALRVGQAVTATHFGTIIAALNLFN